MPLIAALSLWSVLNLACADYLVVSILRLRMNWFLLSKELMVLVGLFLPLLSAQSS